LCNPEKPHKTQQNRDIRAEMPSLPVEICSAHQQHKNPQETLMADSREVMNIRQASQYLGVSPDTLYKYVNEQKIPAFKLGNRWRFKKSKIDQWMEEKSMETEPQGKKKIKAAMKAAGTP
jgi:excisionase family DNA binding protein